MLTKISGLARSIYIILAIVAGFVAMGDLNVALGLVVLGLIAGISMPRERMVLAAATIIALPIVGSALGNIPAVGEHLGAVMANLQLGIAGSFASADITRSETARGTLRTRVWSGGGDSVRWPRINVVTSPTNGVWPDSIR